MSAPDILRIGVCGTAYWAEAVHLPALKEAPGFKLAGVFGRNAERVSALAGQFSIEPHGDFATFLDSVDAVSFAVPPAVQARLALQAIEAGKHVVLEKPVAPTIEEADAIRNAVLAAKTGAVCFLTRNFITELLEFTAKVRGMAPRSAKASFFSSALSAGSPYASSLWRQEKNAILWDVGPHLLTPLTNIFGPVEAIAVKWTEEGGIEARINHRDGRMSSFEASQKMAPGPLRESLTVDTDQGRIALEGLQYDRIAAFRQAAALLLQSVTGAPDAAASFDRAVDIVHVLAAAEQSLEAGGPMRPVR